MNIFKFIETFIIGILKITAYSTIFVLQMVWYIIYRRRDKIADAFGDFGRSVTAVMGDILKSL